MDEMTRNEKPDEVSQLDAFAAEHRSLTWHIILPRYRLHEHLVQDIDCPSIDRGEDIAVFLSWPSDDHLASPFQATRSDSASS